MGAPTVKMKVPKLMINLTALLFFASSVSAFWRLECRGQLGVARIDPIVSLGEPSNHAHVGQGAQNFNFNSDYSTMAISNCTSCSVTQDRSLYWAPAMYFQFDNGSFSLVNTVGGMLAYYFNDNVDNGMQNTLTAFPPGFKMLTGDMLRRNASMCDLGKAMSFWNATDMSQDCLTAKSTGFNCLNYSAPPEGSMEYHTIRPKSFTDANCPQGIRTELMFPSCWDGKSLDAPDHKSHIMYPNLLKTGDCPDSHPVRTPVLFYETIWDTYQFFNYSGQYVMSYGDPTGYGYHGDFFAGWNQTFLQEAVDTCTNPSGEQSDCHVFDLQEPSIQRECELTIPSPLKDEDVTGPVGTLPGRIKIQSGPDQATIGIGPTLSVSSTQAAIATSIKPTSSYNNSTSLVLSPTVTTPTTSFASPIDQASYTTMTSSFTSNGVGFVVVVVEEIMTVTVTTTEINSTAPTKRHVHKHARSGHRV